MQLICFSLFSSWIRSFLLTNSSMPRSQRFASNMWLLHKETHAAEMFCSIYRFDDLSSQYERLVLSCFKIGYLGWVLFHLINQPSSWHQPFCKLSPSLRNSPFLSVHSFFLQGDRMDREAMKCQVLTVSNHSCESLTLEGNTLECIVPTELRAATAKELQVEVRKLMLTAQLHENKNGNHLWSQHHCRGHLMPIESLSDRLCTFCK